MNTSVAGIIDPMREKTIEIVPEKVRAEVFGREDRSDIFWGDVENGEKRLAIAKAVWDGCSNELEKRFGVSANEFDPSIFVVTELSGIGGTFYASTQQILLDEVVCADPGMLAATIAHEMGHYYAFSKRDQYGRWVRLGISPRSADVKPGKAFNVFNEAVTEITMKTLLNKVAKKDPVLKDLGNFVPNTYFEARKLAWVMLRNIEKATDSAVTVDNAYELMEFAVWGRNGQFGALAELRGLMEKTYGREGRAEIERLTVELGKPFDNKVKAATRLQELIRDPKSV